MWVATRDAAYLGTEETGNIPTGLVPITADTWLTLHTPSRLSVISSRELSLDGKLMTALSDFHQIALGTEALNRLLLLADEVNERRTDATYRSADEERARLGLFGVLGPHRPALETGGSALMAALALVGEREGIDFMHPPGRRSSADEASSLRDILNVSGIRHRKVRLSSEDRWGWSRVQLARVSEESIQ